jgi:hypothetical protein
MEKDIRPDDSRVRLAQTKGVSIFYGFRFTLSASINITKVFHLSSRVSSSGLTVAAIPPHIAALATAITYNLPTISLYVGRTRQSTNFVGQDSRDLVVIQIEVR